MTRVAISARRSWRCWLCGWAFGETFAIWMLVKGAIALLTGMPPDPGRAPLQVTPAVLVGVFLLFWLSIWTLGGIAAIGELLRLLWGDDRILVASGRLTVTWLRGPLRLEPIVRARRHPPHRPVRATRLPGARHDDAAPELSRLGTRNQRMEAASALSTELRLVEAADAPRGALPDRWEEIVTPEGERALVPNLTTRRRQAQVASALAMLAAGATFVVAREIPRNSGLVATAAVAFAFTIALAAGAVWLCARPGGVVHRQRRTDPEAALRLDPPRPLRGPSPLPELLVRQRRRLVVPALRRRRSADAGAANAGVALDGSAPLAGHRSSHERREHGARSRRMARARGAARDRGPHDTRGPIDRSRAAARGARAVGTVWKVGVEGRGSAEREEGEDGLVPPSHDLSPRAARGMDRPRPGADRGAARRGRGRRDRPQRPGSPPAAFRRARVARTLGRHRRLRRLAFSSTCGATSLSRSSETSRPTSRIPSRATCTRSPWTRPLPRCSTTARSSASRRPSP